MKKIVLILIGFAMCFQLIQCSSTKTAPAKQKTDPAVEACNAKCAADFSKCLQAAGNNEARKRTCNNNVVKCSSVCPEKAKDYVKPVPQKRSTYSEL